MVELVVISSAPAASEGQNIFLDRKFYEGMSYYAKVWDGPVRALLFDTGERFPFGGDFKKDELPFEVTMKPQGALVQPGDLPQSGLVLCAGDNHQFLDMHKICAERETKLVFLIEYTIESRLRIVQLSRGRSWVKKLYSMLWNLRQERRRRRAFKSADGIQANGYPAYSAYRRANPNTILFLDSRIGEDILVTVPEMEARRVRLHSEAPMRLMYSGRLELLKGAQDLIPVARRLAEKDTPFELDIFGVGSLKDEMQREIDQLNLGHCVRLHEPIDFETELVPFARQNVDVFLSCHRQSDPSCTYVETMGCGVPIVGYDNEMWSGTLDASGAGWRVPLGDWKALADTVTRLASDPAEVAEKADCAMAFAKQHLFEVEYAERIEHLKNVVR